ncbi:MAG: hypothetical protein H6660_02470 [Ardenticatenaceae bacterium]|nr:hypothetical protein [Ardenticatenaceae bacterium]
MCKSLETLGQELRQAQGLLLTQTEATMHNRQNWADALAEFGLHAEVVTNGANLPAKVANKKVTRYLAINDDAAQHARSALAASGVPVLLRYMVNVTPLVTPTDEKKSKDARTQFRNEHPHVPQEKWPELWEAGFVRPFELIESHACGIQRLGVLRMDVDDLGRIFAEGFGGDGGLAQTVALSFAMSLFFEGWVAALARRADNNRDVVYSIYSGGDDLFIVAAWDVLPDLAHNIAQDLSSYAAHNPHIHVSAGITLHGGKFPLYQAARAAEEALDQAKDFSRNGTCKNAFTFLGRTLSWNEYIDLQTTFVEFANLVAPKDNDAPHAPQRLLQLLMQMETLYTQHRRYQLVSGQQAEKVYWGPWHWRSAYLLNRLAKQNKDVRDDILAIAAQLSGENFSRITMLGLAARWAELYTREDHKNKEVIDGRE